MELKVLNSLDPANPFFGLCQAAVVISAACHTTHTKPPHDASDNVSRTQRAMTSSPVLRVLYMFYVVVLFSSSPIG